MAESNKRKFKSSSSFAFFFKIIIQNLGTPKLLERSRVSGVSQSGIKSICSSIHVLLPRFSQFSYMFLLLATVCRFSLSVVELVDSRSVMSLLLKRNFTTEVLENSSDSLI